MAMSPFQRGQTTGPGIGLRPITPAVGPLTRPGAAPAIQAAPPAGLPPDAWAAVNKIGKKSPAKPGPLGASMVKRFSPSPINDAKMQELMGVQNKGKLENELSALDVANMDNVNWQQLLSKFGVFA